jgi:hypothetical protein
MFWNQTRPLQLEPLRFSDTRVMPKPLTHGSVLNESGCVDGGHISLSGAYLCQECGIAFGLRTKPSPFTT